MKTKCVIYARVSTTLQDTESQIQDLQKWAINNDFEIVCNPFKETASGYTDKDKEIPERPELDRLKEFIKTHKIKQVITYELSRLGRSTRQTLNEINYFTSEGVNIFFKKDNINTISNNGINNLIITILSGIAEMEGTTLKDRVKRGRMHSASLGKRVGFTKMPLGFASDENDYIIINEEDADLVRTMYKAVASGISSNRLAKDLNAKGIPTYNDKVGKKTTLTNGLVIATKWNPKTIKNIIKNTRYKGYRNYGGVTFALPRIVSDEIWEEANRKIDDHIGYLSRTKYDYLFKSKITCGQCGYTIKSLRKYSKLGNDVLYYTCQSYLHTGQNCNCGRFRSEIFDENLYKILFERSRGVQTAIDREKSVSQRAELAKKLEYWNREKETSIKEQGRVKTLFIKGMSSEDEMDIDYGKLASKINEANTEIARIEKAINHIDKPIDYKTIEKYYLNADFSTKRSFVEEYVQRIKVYKVEKIDFDLSEIAVPWMDWEDGRIPVKIERFVKPKKNEVIWYVEIWAFDDIDPIKVLMTSATGTNFVSNNLKFEKETKIIDFNL